MKNKHCLQKDWENKCHDPFSAIAKNYFIVHLDVLSKVSGIVHIN